MNCELEMLLLLGGFVAASGLMMFAVGVASHATACRAPKTLWGNSGTTRRAIERFARSNQTEEGEDLKD